MKLNKIMIGFLIAAVIVCGTVLCARVNHSKKNKIDKEPDNTVKEAVDTINYGNIRQNGLLVQAGEWIYYSNSDDNRTLYRKNLTNGITEKLNDTESDYLNVCDNSIIYRQVDEHNISKITMDGKEDEVIYNGMVNDVVYDDGKVYFVDSTDSTRLLRMEPNGEKVMLLNSDDNYVSAPMVSQHEVIFYHYWASDRGELMALNCDTMERRTLCEGDIINPILDNGKVYYVDNWKQSINSIDINTLEKENVYKFEGQTPWDIVKMEDYIYYAEENAIVKLSITTHQKEKVLSVSGRILSFGITPNAILATYSIDNECKMHLVTY